MAEQPLVSIGILSYNRPGDLRVAIDSVLAQTYVNLEILISDNGSQVAESVAVIAEYAARDARIRPFYHQQNRGVHFNLKFVAEQASGEYFCWLAGDDAYSPNYIEDCIAVLSKEPEVVMASAIPVVLGSQNPVQFQYLPHTPGLPRAEKYSLLVRHVFTDLNLFYYGVIRLEALLQCHLHYKKFFRSDLLLLFELLAFGDIAIVADKPGLLYNIHEGQISTSPLRYRKILMEHAHSFAERRAFFTAYISYMIMIVWRRKGLSIVSRTKIVRQIFAVYIQSKRYHMVKYDLGLDRIIHMAKRLAGKQ